MDWTTIGVIALVIVIWVIAPIIIIIAVQRLRGPADKRDAAYAQNQLIMLSDRLRRGDIDLETFTREWEKHQGVLRDIRNKQLGRAA